MDDGKERKPMKTAASMPALSLRPAVAAAAMRDNRCQTVGARDADDVKQPPIKSSMSSCHIVRKRPPPPATDGPPIPNTADDNDVPPFVFVDEKSVPKL